MLPPLLPLRETHIIGRNCREWVLGGERTPQLREAGYSWVGHGLIRPPYRMVRMACSNAHIVVCTEGRGRALIEGRFVDWRPGQVLLCPQGAFHAFEACSRSPWGIAWVFFPDTGPARLLEGDRTRLVEADGAAFAGTLQLLTREALGACEPAAMQALVTLLKTHTRRLAGPRRGDTRLASLWERVEADLAQDWSCAALARLVSLSEEHLRRLCRAQHGRSPMHYVHELRMQRAALLLQSSSEKVESIAYRVGYSSVYAFSNAFKRWSGLPPARFRAG